MTDIVIATTDNSNRLLVVPASADGATFVREYFAHIVSFHPTYVTDGTYIHPSLAREVRDVALSSGLDVFLTFPLP